MPGVEYDPYHVYLIEEFSDDSKIEAQKIYRKIGILSEYTANSNPFYGRIRTLQQGNVRELRVIYNVEFESKQVALHIEKRVHALLKHRGHETRHYVTGQAGHGEWFEVTTEDAVVAIDDVVRQYTEERAANIENFGDELHPVRKTLVAKMVDSFRSVTDLFVFD